MERLHAVRKVSRNREMTLCHGHSEDAFSEMR
jgi:hypothetical protein